MLLIETSFRNAAVGEVFGFKPPAGFAKQLAQHRLRPGDPWVVVQIANSPLYIMAAEPRCCQKCAAVLAEDAKFCGLCGTEASLDGAPAIDAVAFRLRGAQVPRIFPLPVLDAPPVLTGGDVNLIQDSADAIVFATRKGMSAGSYPPPRHRAGRPRACGRGRDDREVTRARRGRFGTLSGSESTRRRALGSRGARTSSCSS